MAGNIIFEKGDLFAVEADVIAHGCNCQGVMGAGIAKAFKAKFPVMYEKYRDECYIGNYIPGDFMAWEENGVTGVNLFTQENPGADATTNAFYISLMGVSQRMTRAYLVNPPVLAMPLIGCGIGGLEYYEFIWVVRNVAQFFPNLTYKVVYNDDNENLVLERHRV